MIGQNLSLQQSGAPVSSAWATRQEASETGEAQWFQQRSNVNIDMYLYLFQPSFHPDQPVWCLESGAAALPIRVHCDLNILIKVTVKLSTFKPKYMVEDFHLAMAAQHINIMAIFCTQQTNCILSICRWCYEAVRTKTRDVSERRPTEGPWEKPCCGRQGEGHEVRRLVLHQEGAVPGQMQQVERRSYASCFSFFAES